jgi:hypothetical protein
MIRSGKARYSRAETRRRGEEEKTFWCGYRANSSSGNRLSGVWVVFQAVYRPYKSIDQ